MSDQENAIEERMDIPQQDDYPSDVEDGAPAAAPAENAAEADFEGEEVPEEEVPEEADAADNEDGDSAVAADEEGEEEQKDEEQQEGGEEEEEALEAQEQPEDEEDFEEGDITDPAVFIEEVRRIEEIRLTVFRGLSSMAKPDEDDENHVNVLDLFDDTQAEEERLFSAMPPYVVDAINKKKNINKDRNATIESRIPKPDKSANDSRYLEEKRAFVDPAQPLQLPYNLERDRREHPEKFNRDGTYHDLFYGDGSAIVFEPPADNKRKQIAEEQSRRIKPRRDPPPQWEPPVKKPLKVDPDFVPSCANVDNSSRRQSLKARQSQQNKKSPGKAKTKPKAKATS